MLQRSWKSLWSFCILSFSVWSCTSSRSASPFSRTEFTDGSWDSTICCSDLSHRDKKEKQPSHWGDQEEITQVPGIATTPPTSEKDLANIYWLNEIQSIKKRVLCHSVCFFTLFYRGGKSTCNGLAWRRRIEKMSFSETEHSSYFCLSLHYFLQRQMSTKGTVFQFRDHDVCCSLN